MREAQRTAARRRQQRVRLIVAAAIMLAIVAIGVLIQMDRTTVDEDSARPAGVAEAGGGVPAPGTPAAGAPLVELYEDFQCPHCKDFEDSVGPAISQIVADGSAEITYRPVAFLGDDSVRAQAAAGCAADAGEFVAYHHVLFAHQGDGFSVDQLVAFGAEAGLTGSAFEACVRDQTYESWATASTQAFTRRGVGGTPAVYIDGEKWEPDQYTPDGLLAAIDAAR